MSNRAKKILTASQRRDNLFIGTDWSGKDKRLGTEPQVPLPRWANAARRRILFAKRELIDCGMKLIATFLVLPFFVVFLATGCSKKADPTPGPTPTPTPGGGNTTPTTPASTFTVDGRWECLADGVPYAGTVDTSYMVTGPSSSGGDTTIWCTGTSDNKRANIHFRFIVNRSAYSSPTINTTSRGHFTFDTTGSVLLQASYNGGVNIAYSVDTLKEGKLKARFSGTANDVPLIGGVSVHTITAGKFSCEIGKGSGEPKFFSFTSTNNPLATGNLAGFFRRARLLTNEIMLDGIAFAYEPTSKFRLVVRTGGTVKPGVYKSSQGEAGLQYYVPSLNSHYVNDSLGDLTVTITSVADNVVRGTFSGANFNGTPITAGAFSCRLKDYRPQAELPTRWQFSFDEQTLGYNCYAGNITGAVRAQAGGRYLLTVNGESDQGTSVYKLVLSSSAPLTTGLYRANQFGGTNRIDSVYFRSNEPLWNGNTQYLYTASYLDTWCRVDSLDANKVVGTLYGKLAVFYSSGGSSATDVKLGTFRGTF